MDQALLSVLSANGLDHKESLVYTALLEFGEGAVTDIAKRAGLKRSIVYVVLDRLQERGLVSIVPGRGVRRYTAADPQKLLANVQSNVAALKQFVPVLRAMQASGIGKPKIEMFEGAGGVASVYRQFELGREARYLAAMAQHEKYFRAEVERWIRGYESGAIATVGKNLVVNDASGRRFAARINRSARQTVRLLPANVAVDLDFAIVDDRVAITSFDPLYIVVIQHAAIARSLTILFDLAWTQAGSRKQS